MLDWLPGADPATESDGQKFVTRALELYQNYVTPNQRRKVTIAVTEIDGLEIAAVYHRDQKSADRIAGLLRKAGIAAMGTSDVHAEVAIYESEPRLIAIGISNIGGPCGACARYFENTATGFANVYWDDAIWISP